MFVRKGGGGGQAILRVRGGKLPRRLNQYPYLWWKMKNG